MLKRGALRSVKMSVQFFYKVQTRLDVIVNMLMQLTCSSGPCFFVLLTRMGVSVVTLKFNLTFFKWSKRGWGNRCFKYTDMANV